RALELMGVGLAGAAVPSARRHLRPSDNCDPFRGRCGTNVFCGQPATKGTGCLYTCCSPSDICCVSLANSSAGCCIPGKHVCHEGFCDCAIPCGPDGKTCCFPGEVCGGRSLAKRHCCLPGKHCGDACCASDQVCVNDELGACCFPGRTGCFPKHN